MSSNGEARIDPREHFVARAERIAASLPFVEAVERGARDLALVLVIGGTRRHVYLGNLFAETRDMSPDERGARIRAFFAVLREHDDTSSTAWEDVEGSLVPVARQVGYTVQRHEGKEIRFLQRPFVPFVVACVVIDRPRSMTIVLDQMPATWGVSAATVFEASHWVLARAHDDADVALYDADAPYPIFHVARDDSYQSSRLLLPGFLASFAGRVRGRPIAAIPDRGTLLITGDGDVRAIERLARSAEAEFRASTRNISPALYTMDDAGAVQPYRVPDDHPAAVIVRRGHLMLAMDAYAAQKPQLEAAFEARGADVFVASYTAVEREGRLPTSFAVWAEGVDGLLPLAEHVVFVRATDRRMTAVPWATAAAIVGDAWVVEAGIDPPRMRTLRWPSPAQMAELEAHAAAL